MITENDRKFIGYAVTECAKEGVQVTFLPKSILKTDNISCSGWFNDGERKLFVATRNPMKSWISILLHEFCHFKQWQTKEPSFANLMRHPHLDNDIWEWLDGKKIPIERVRKSIQAYQEMELNCEKMAVEYLESFNLSINKIDYIKGANVYILFYGVVKSTREWIDYPPNDNKLYSIVPSRLVKSFRLPAGFKKRIINFSKK